MGMAPLVESSVMSFEEACLLVLALVPPPTLPRLMSIVH